jgi:hypothetical protein
MERFTFWKRWLFIVGLIVTAFGILLAFFSGTMLFESFNSRIDHVFWGGAAVPQNVVAFQRWINGVLGGVVTECGMFLSFVAYYPFRRKEKWAWNCVLAALCVWFFIDTPISLYFKVYVNALFNLVLFIAILLPLVFTRQDFDQRNRLTVDLDL